MPSDATLAEMESARLGPRASPRGRYIILRTHAQGGLGTVSIALDEMLGRKVALKQMRADLADVPQFRRRFIHEAEITGQLEHPGIIPIYALGQDEDGRPYYAMKFVEGQTFEQAIAEYHAKPSAMALRGLLRRFVEICQAIAYAHSQGIIHRDIKPSNIMLGKFGETVILDWGLAKRVAEMNHGNGGGATSSSPEASDAPLPAAPGKPVGTPAYMPPEQAVGRFDVGPAADVYSLGAVLYQLLCGRAPYSGANSADVVSQVVRGSSARPSSIAKVPEALEAVCVKAMSRDPAGRYTVAQLAGEIERWLGDEPLVSYRGTFLEAAGRWVKHHRTTAAATLSILLATIVGLSIGTVLITRANRKTHVALSEKAAALVRENEQRQRAEERERLARRSLYAANMRAAHEAWVDGNARRTLELLNSNRPARDSPQPDLRGFVWHYLWHQAVGARLDRMRIPGPAHGEVLFAPDGKLLAATTRDGSIVLYDVRARQQARVLRGPDAGTVSAFAFSPDGRTLAAARDEPRIRLWDAHTGEPRASIEIDGAGAGAGTGDGARANGIAYSPDGKLLAAAVQDGSIRIWDTTSGAEVRRWDGHVTPPAFHNPQEPRTGAVSCAFAPDGSILASGGRDGAIRCWDPATGKELRTIAQQRFPVSYLCFSPDGRQLAASLGWDVVLWDPRTAEQIAVHEHVGGVGPVSFSRDGRLMASSSGGGQINLFDRTSGSKTSFASSGSTYAHLAPDGTLVACTSDGGTLIDLWDATGGRPNRIGDTAHPPAVVALNGDGSVAIVGTATGMIELWDTITGRMTRRVESGAPTTAMALATGAPIVATGDERGDLTVWDTNSLSVRARVPAHDRAVSSISVAPDASIIVTADSAGTVKVWDGRSLERRATFEDAGNVVALAPDRRHVAAAPTLALWNIDTATRTRQLSSVSARFFALAFAPDGSRLAAGSEGGNADVYDLRRAPNEDARAFRLQTDRFTVASLAFFPDGEQLVTTNPYDTIQFWDTVTREECLTLEANVSVRAPIAMSADGTMLATVSREGYISLWRAPRVELPPR